MSDAKGRLEYLRHFPEHLQPSVDAALHEAEGEFLDLRNQSEYLHGGERTFLFAPILKVFVVYAEQIARAEEEGLWTGEEAREGVEQCLIDIAKYFYRKYRKGPYDDRSCSDFAYSDITPRVRLSKEYRKVQDRLREAARSRVRPLRTAVAPTTVASPEPQAASQSEHILTSVAPEKKLRQFKEPNHDLLKNQDATLNRKNAADALGVTARTLDRWVKDTVLTPVGHGARKRFKTKDLLRLLKEKNLGQSGQE